MAAHWSVPSDSGFCVYSPQLGALCSPVPFVWSEENLSAYVIVKSTGMKVNTVQNMDNSRVFIFRSVDLLVCLGVTDLLMLLVFLSFAPPTQTKSCNSLTASKHSTTNGSEAVCCKGQTNKSISWFLMHMHACIVSQCYYDLIYYSFILFIIVNWHWSTPPPMIIDIYICVCV